MSYHPYSARQQQPQSQQQPYDDTASDIGSDIMTVTDLHTIMNGDMMSPTNTQDPSSSSQQSQSFDPTQQQNPYGTHPYPSLPLPPPPPTPSDHSYPYPSHTIPGIPASGNSLHDVDAYTVTGSDIHTVIDDIHTVEGGGTVGTGPDPGRNNGNITASHAGSSDDRHAASLGHAQYHSDDLASSGLPPSEPAATRGSASGTGASLAAAAAAVGSSFWSRTFGGNNINTAGSFSATAKSNPVPVRTMPSDEDFFDNREDGLYRTASGDDPKGRVRSNDLAPPPAMIIVGSSSHSQRQLLQNTTTMTTSRKSATGSQASLSNDASASVWKQRLCGLRADRLVVLLLLVLLVAVAVIVGAVVVTDKFGSSSQNSASESAQSSNNNSNNFDDANTSLNNGDETVSLTRTPTVSVAATKRPSAAPAPVQFDNVAPSPTTKKTSRPVADEPANEAPSPVVGETTASPVASPPPTTMSPMEILESPMPTSCNVVNDDRVIFPIDGVDRNCTWLSRRPNDREVECVPGELGHMFCRETCRHCGPAPPDAILWPEDKCGSDSDSVSFPTGETSTGNCAWLASSPADVDRLCQIGEPAFDACRETCRNCGIPPVVEGTNPPTTGPPVAMATSSSPTTAPPTTSAPPGPTTAPPVAATSSSPTTASPTTAAPVEALATPAPTPTTPPINSGVGSSIEELVSFAVSVSPNSEDSLNDSSSPQFRALEWLGASVASGDIAFDVTEEQLVQKWSLATFALSIDWENEWLNSGTTDECSWDGVSCSSTTVVGIELSNRGIQGEFPPELSLLSQLERLIVSENGMRGELPSSFGNLASLEDFRMDRNEFTGTIPDSIGGMSSLRIWFLERNIDITGSMPDSIGSLPNLSELVFYYTSITGTLTSDVCPLDVLTLDCRQVESTCYTNCFFRCGGDTGVSCEDVEN